MDEVKKEQLRREILQKTAEYYHLVLEPEQNAPFVPGKSKIQYAGRVFDESELENLVERIVVTSSGSLVTRGSVFNALNPTGRSPAARPEVDLPLRQQVAAYEREIILHTLERTGSMRKAAKVLGVDHSTLVKKCRQYGQVDPAQEW